MTQQDAIVVGAGPNGLAAAIRLAQAGLRVLVLEANETLGGGLRSQNVTLPGFVHDVCSAIHPMAVASPFFRSLPLEQYGLRWIHPPVPVAHPLDDGRAVQLERSVSVTAQALGPDGTRYANLIQPLVDQWQALASEFLQPILHLPERPLLLARFGWKSIQSAAGLARRRFEDDRARAVFAGVAAHSFLPLEQKASASFGLVLAMMAHAVGWPFPEGGAQSLADALAAHLRSLGGSIQMRCRVESLNALPPARAVLLDLTPRQVLQVAGERLPARYRRQLERYRYGPGVFKLDYALAGPIPWTAEVCRRAGTVHVGGTLEEICRSERQVADGQIPERPFVLIAQQSLFDSTRAPRGQHTAWAYCHVPNGSDVNMTTGIERQIERFAPGFRDRVLARHTMNCAQLEQHNANLVGGDISGGAMNLWHLLARPVLKWNPYRTPVQGLYLCSSSTPPGGGVHGMCGFRAANAALRDVFRKAKAGSIEERLKTDQSGWP